MEDATAAAWRDCIRSAGSIECEREALARLVDEDQDPAEIYYYEAVSDPLSASDEPGAKVVRRPVRAQTPAVCPSTSTLRRQEHRMTI